MESPTDAVLQAEVSLTTFGKIISSGLLVGNQHKLRGALPV